MADGILAVEASEGIAQEDTIAVEALLDGSWPENQSGARTMTYLVVDRRAVWALCSLASAKDLPEYAPPLVQQPLSHIDGYTLFA